MGDFGPFMPDPEALLQAPEYGDFEALVGLLKLHAIDAWVRDQVKGHLIAIDPDRYRIALITGAAVSSLTRPGKDGMGGGTWLHEDGGDLEQQPPVADHINPEAFDGVRDSIDRIVDRWRDLPDPTAIETVVRPSKSASDTLSTTTITDEDGVVRGGGMIQSSLASIDQNCSAMAGTTIARFKDEFVNFLSGTISNLYAISVVRTEAVVAEQALWANARERVPVILRQASSAFYDYAHYEGQGTDWKVILKTITYVADAVAMVGRVYAPVGITASLVSLGLTIASDTIPDKTVEEKPEDYDSTLLALKTTLDTLDKQTKSVEEVVQSTLKANYGSVVDNRRVYDLTLVPLRTDSDVRIIEEVLVNDIVTVHMPKIAEYLEQAARLTESCRPDSVVTRNPDVGIGQTGPSAAINSISDLLNQLLGDLAWEVRAGARNLELAVDYFFEREAQVAQDLNRLADEVEQGSGIEPLGGAVAAGARAQAPVLDNLDDVLGG